MHVVLAYCSSTKYDYAGREPGVINTSARPRSDLNIIRIDEHHCLCGTLTQKAGDYVCILFVGNRDENVTGLFENSYWVLVERILTSLGTVMKL